VLLQLLGNRLFLGRCGNLVVLFLRNFFLLGFRLIFLDGFFLALGS